MKLLIIMALLLSSFYAVDVLDPPSDLTVELDNFNAILRWQDNSINEEGFWIYRDDAKHAKLPANTTSYVDDISDSKRHRYRVSAFLGDEESELSNEVNVKAEGISDRVVYLGIPLLIIMIIIAWRLGKGEDKEDQESMTEEEKDVPILLFDRIRKV